MTSATAPGDRLAVATTAAQLLYDRHRYLDAFAASAEYWTAITDLRQLTTEQLILAGRLAGRLGGPRLSRRLFRAAVERDPGSPAVRYFTRHLKVRGRTLLDELRDFEARPDIGGDDPALRAAWYASFALTWAGLRDFQRAYECLATAHSLAQGDSWVLACESGVLGLDDRWADALAAADRARAVDDGAPLAAVSQGTCLLNLGRARESVQTLRAAAERGQSFEVAAYASWHHCALAETLEERDRQPVLEQASRLLDRACSLAPLADREVKQGLARARLDIASLHDDYTEIERWMEEVHSPFHRHVVANLRQNPTGRRLHLRCRRAVQKYAACLPTSVAMAMSANGLEMSTDEMATAITFGGTAAWAAVDWLRARGHHVRSFAVTAELSRALIQARIAFVLNWQADDSGHAVAIVGLDERAQTLIVQDPGTFRGTEYLLGILGAAPSPLGTMGIAVVPPERAADLDALLPPDAEVMEAALALQRAFVTHGPAAARPIATDLALRFPDHPGARQLEAVQLLADGHIGLALPQLQQLLARFPDAPDLRVHVLSAYHALRNTARLRLVLKDIVEQDLLPGLTAEQAWIRPPDRYVFGYADLLRLSSATRAEASCLLHSLIRRQPASAGAWHTLGDLLSHTSDGAGAALCLRLASCLDFSDEHYATAYTDALRGLGRPGEGLSWLEFRMRSAGASPQGVGTWISWVAALEDHGEPARALAACQEAIERHRRSVALLAFAVPFFGRMGQWDASGDHLRALKALENPAAFREAAAQFHSMRGELADAIEHAESWILDAPFAMNARRTLLELVATRDGPDASAERAKAWMRANPGHEEFEDAYGAALGLAGAPRWKKDVIYRRRARRNPEDAVAWLEMASTALQVYAGAAEHRRATLVPRIEALLAGCQRTADGSTPTLRAQAWWSEVRGDWAGAVSRWLEVHEREPVGNDSCRRAWECSARFPDAERRRVWNEIRPRLLGAPGHLSIARDVMALLVERFGVSEANKELEQLGLVRRLPTVLRGTHQQVLEPAGLLQVGRACFVLSKTPLLTPSVPKPLVGSGLQVPDLQREVELRSVVVRRRGRRTASRTNQQDLVADLRTHAHAHAVRPGRREWSGLRFVEHLGAVEPRVPHHHAVGRLGTAEEGPDDVAPFGQDFDFRGRRHRKIVTDGRQASPGNGPAGKSDRDRLPRRGLAGRRTRARNACHAGRDEKMRDESSGHQGSVPQASHPSRSTAPPREEVTAVCRGGSPPIRSSVRGRRLRAGTRAGAAHCF